MKTFGKLAVLFVFIGSMLFLLGFFQFIQDMQDLDAPGFNMPVQHLRHGYSMGAQ